MGKRSSSSSSVNGLCHFQDKEGNGYTNVLQIECKNYNAGVDKKVFEEVVKRVRPLCKVSILFVSSLQNIFAKNGSWDEFANGILGETNPIAFLTIGEKGVAWLELENGAIWLGPTDATDLLCVVVETGAMI